MEIIILLLIGSMIFFPIEQYLKLYFVVNIFKPKNNLFGVVSQKS